MPWTTVAKPTGDTWTKQAFEGRQTYDEATLTYDESSVYYDSVNESAWTEVPKPSGYSFISAGMITGLLMPLTYSVPITTADPWTRVSKPTD